jgi:hypothetical protein
MRIKQFNKIKKSAITASTAFLLFSAMTKSIYAQTIGPVAPPPFISDYGSTPAGAFSMLIGVIIRTIIVVAGIYATFNFLIAGLSFMSAGGDPKKIADAWAKIWQTILGLLITAAAFVIGGIVSYLLFGDLRTIFSVRIFGPS